MYNLSLLEKLCTSRGISGDESSIRDIIIDEIKDFATDYYTDNLGNLIVFKKGRNKPEHKLMISAHMDEVGFMVTDITDDGLLKFDEVGGIDRRVLPATSVLVNGSVNGVILNKPIHLCAGDEKSLIPKISEMYIDIGADSREEALKHVLPGDSVSFEAFYKDNGETIITKAIDDRAGCFMMIQLIQSELEYDMYFTFVVQEEVGLNGARVAAYSVNPDFAIVLESTTAADVPGISGQKQVCNVGQGAVIGYMDRRTIYDKALINEALNISESENINLQFKRMIAGGNDAGVIHTARGGVRTLAISLPCRYLHAQLSLIAKTDLDSAYELTQRLCNRICGGKV